MTRACNARSRARKTEIPFLSGLLVDDDDNDDDRYHVHRTSMLLKKLYRVRRSGGNEKTKKERKKDREGGEKESTGKGEEVLTQGIGFIFVLPRASRVAH